MSASTENLFPSIAGVTVPSSPSIRAAFAYVEAHSTPEVTRHVIRSTYYALIIASKLPSMTNISKSSLVLATLMHDLGWDPTGALVSLDKRFEVDGANAARDFLRSDSTSAGMDEVELQLIWDAIALHSTPSISAHKQPEVAAASLGITTDFFGPNVMGGGIVTVEEWRAVVATYPMVGVWEGVRDALCGLCRTKPETTYDNFVGQFGEKYLEGYSLQGKLTIDMLEDALAGLDKFKAGSSSACHCSRKNIVFS